jgi:hypothetical protein
MSNATELGSDVVTAGAALAGLILVYLGAVATGYASFEASQQRAVRTAFARRAWFAFTGIMFCLFSVAFAIIGKWWVSTCWSCAAIIGLFVALAWSAIIALVAAMDIK